MRNPGFKRYSRIVGRAIRMLKDDQALPVDLQTQLLAIGVDISALEETYG